MPTLKYWEDPNWVPINATPDGVLDVKQFGVKGDGVVDDTSALQNAFSHFTSKGIRGTIHIPEGTYKITSTLTVDVAYVSIHCLGLLDASSMTEGAAINFTGSVNPPYTQSMTVIEGIELSGAGSTTDTMGFQFHTPVSTGNASSHITVRNCNVHNFGIGMEYGDRAYAINHYGNDIYRCGTCIHSSGGITDGGERVSFHGCTFFNSGLALDVNNPNSGWHFTACSFDYNNQQMNINQAKVFIHQCHIETDTYTDIPFTVKGNGGVLVIHGSWILETSGTKNHSHVFDITAPTTVTVDACLINNVNTSSGHLATGTGHITVKDITSYTITELCKILSPTENLLGDGGFENFPQDQIYISADTAALDDRYVGANISLVKDTTEFRSGAASLKVLKNFGNGSASAFQIVVPVRELARVGIEFYYKKTDDSSGTVNLSWGWYALRGYNELYVPSASKASAQGSTTIVFPSATVDWTKKVLVGEPWGQRPTWATHVYINFNLASYTGGTGKGFFLDDFLITQM